VPTKRKEIESRGKMKKGNNKKLAASKVVRQVF
jgi:hypothetical protein